MANVNQQAYENWANYLNANKNFSMFNPYDAYTSFTNQVAANAPTWYDALGRFAVGLPAFKAGINAYDKLQKLKNQNEQGNAQNGGVNSDAIRKGVTNAFEQQANIPQYFGSMLKSAGADDNAVAHTDPYGNSYTVGELTSPTFGGTIDSLQKFHNPFLYSLPQQKNNPFGNNFLKLYSIGGNDNG